MTSGGGGGGDCTASLCTRLRPKKPKKGLTDSFLQLVQSVKHKTVIDCTSVTGCCTGRVQRAACLQPGDVNGSDSELVHGLRSVSLLFESVSEYKTKQSAHQQSKQGRDESAC